MLNSRGIYYYQHFSPHNVSADRKVWVPML